ncbi:Hypothetical predicted protein [Paramuricea clavata]|uniref:Uncharacterized protein n=1 Tax=Paramuricea clavata TaxID=317549 RepID=A0A6S7GSN2_PARCT|nr:Hypothetical predicted protein [Paramuricea clavata]
MNPSNPTYVFKTSTVSLNIALNMQQSADHFMRKEYCYFDGTHSRCHGLKTLTLWTYHPLLRKLVKLATMDCERENQECISLFWKLWNDALSEISKNPAYTFDPKGWCMDEAGANWSAIEEVFGSEALSKCKSCEFHFKDCRNRHRRVLSTQEEKDKFTELTDRMLYATTTSTYQKNLMELLNFIDEVRRPNLKSWVNWWHDRRDHIFRAWRPANNPPNTNLAEVGHSSWAHQGAKNLDLITAAKEDITEMVRLEVSIQTFQSGESKPGNGPSFEQGICKSYYEQQRTAKEFADQLCSGFTEISRSVTHRVDQSASHRADKEVRSAHTRTRHSQEFTRSLELAKRYRLCVTSVDYRTEVNCRFVCKCHDDDIIVTIAHKPLCLKNGDICKYTRNGTQVCSHILYVLLNKVGLEEDDGRLDQIAYTTSELKSMLAKFATKSPSHVLVGQALSAPVPTKKSSEWKLQRMPLQGVDLSQNVKAAASVFL